MNPKLVPLRILLALFGMLLFLSSCGGGQSGCPTCGTATNGPIGLLNIEYVPEHNPTGLPGGPFISFDIGFVDPVNRLYSISDRLGVDVAVFSDTSNVALWAIGGDNSVAENGNDASRCWASATQTIPPVVSAQGNYQRFACKSNVGAFDFFVPGVPPGHAAPSNPHFGGFTGGTCCSPRAAQLNPLTGPNGIEVTSDGNFEVVSSPASLFVFDLRPMLSSGYQSAPQVTAVIPTGSSPDYDGPLGVGPCINSAQNRAFTDPTCGDLRADELGTTGGVVGPFPDGQKHFLVGIINGDPGLPFFSIIDLTQVVAPSANPTPLQALQQHCLPYNPAAPFSPGSPVNLNQTPPQPANYSSCIVGQIYYDGAAQNDINTVVDNGGANGGGAFPCPDPTVFFYGAVTSTSGVTTTGLAGVPVPSGSSGPAAGGASLNPVIPCHHGPMLLNSPTPQTGGAFCKVQGSTSPAVAAPAACTGSVGPAGLGGLIYYPPTKSFLLTNGNTVADITVGSVDVIDPLHPLPGGVYGPVVTNSFPIYNCMPTGVSLGPGTDVLVSCANHDGRAFAPSAVIINGTTGEVLKTVNNIGYTDQTWYNPGDNNYYLASGGFPTGPVLGVIDAGTRQWLQNVPTQGNSHSVAADPINNQIYVPMGTGPLCLAQSAIGCVGIFGKQ
jgi:hypothetical protein